jgi:hypothetical protein
MFVVREVHLKPDARQQAVQSWLIPESFYDEWLDAFVKAYAPQRSAEDIELDERLRELEDTFKSFLASKEGQEVQALEDILRSCGGDVYKLRDTLLKAVKELCSPKRVLGLHTGNAMTEEAKLALMDARQMRLRSVVMACLKGIWRSGVGGEVLRMATDNVVRMIQRFEERADDVCTAKTGSQWHDLKELLLEIRPDEETQHDEIEGGSSGSEGGAEAASKKKRRVDTPIEGKGTKTLIEAALLDLGGQATTAEIFQWVESHPEVTARHSRIHLNMNTSKAVNRQGKTLPVWQNTMRSILCHRFEGTRIKGRGIVWHRKGEAPEGLVQAALTDEPQERKVGSRLHKRHNADGDGATDKVAEGKKRAVRKRPAAQAALADASAPGSAVADPVEQQAVRGKLKRDVNRSSTIAADRGIAVEGVAPKRPRKSKAISSEPSASDPLALLLDEAIDSAKSQLESAI